MTRIITLDRHAKRDGDIRKLVCLTDVIQGLDFMTTRNEKMRILGGGGGGGHCWPRPNYSHGYGNIIMTDQ